MNEPNDVKKEEKVAWKDAKRILFWYWRLSRDYSRWLLLSMITYGIAAITSSIIVVLILKKIIDIVSSNTNVWSSALQEQIFLLVAVIFFQNILFRIGDLGLRKYQVPARANIARFTFSEVQKQSYNFFTNTFVGSTVSQAKRFEDGFSVLSDSFVFTIWWQSIVLISMLITLTFISAPLAMVYIFCVLILFGVTVPALKQRMQYDAMEGEASSRLTGRFADVLTNIINLKIFSSFSFEKENFDSVVNDRAEIENKSYRLANKLIAIQAFLGEVLGLVMIITAIWLWTEGRVTAGTILLVISFSQSLFHIIFQFTRVITRLLQALANAKEMVDIFELHPTLLDRSNPQVFEVTRGEIQFQNLTYQYSQGKKVFNGINFTIQAGEKVGLVGPSGGGKTTITKLLLRLMDPVSGSIQIDGQDIREISQDSLRQAISYVSQDPTLFHRSLSENISYGKFTASEEEIVEAAKKAHAHDFIKSLPNGYDTEVGERGVKLSGGQRQRIAIARAILKDAPILVMDEATSSLDTVSERAIRDSLDEMMKGKTVLIIAHRLSTVQKLDRIIVLDKNGAIAEVGSHQDLLAKGGLYAKLWEHQVGGFLSEEG